MRKMFVGYKKLSSDLIYNNIRFNTAKGETSVIGNLNDPIKLNLIC